MAAVAAEVIIELGARILVALLELVSRERQVAVSKSIGVRALKKLELRREAQAALDARRK